jgi:hypothetical protein
LPKVPEGLTPEEIFKLDIANMEEIVNKYKSEGFNFFTLATNNNLVEPFILGDLEELGFKNINERHGSVQFYVPFLKTNVAAKIGALNTWTAVDPDPYPDLISDNLNNYIAPFSEQPKTGQLAIIYQINEQLVINPAVKLAVDTYRQVASDLDIVVNEFPVDEYFDNQLGLQAIEGINNLPPGSLVLLAFPNESLEIENLANSFRFRINSGDLTNTDVIYITNTFVPINYSLTTINEPFPIEIISGLISSRSPYLPPFYLSTEDLQFSFNTTDFINNNITDVFDSIAFASTYVSCGPIYGSSGLQKFNSAHSTVDPFIASYTYPANSKTRIINSIDDNPKFVETSNAYPSRLGACCCEITCTKSTGPCKFSSSPFQ